MPHADPSIVETERQLGNLFRAMSDELSTIAMHKREHLRIVLEESVRATGVVTGLERYRFCHCVLTGMLTQR